MFCIINDINVVGPVVFMPACTAHIPYALHLGTNQSKMSTGV